MTDTTVELDNVTLTSTDNTEVLIETGTTEPCIENKTGVVEGYKKEYSIVGDGLYASISADDAPQWLLNVVDTVVINSLANGLTDVELLKNSVLTALSELDVAKNQYQELINIEATVEGVVASRLATLNATVDANSATISDLEVSKVTADEALTIAANHLESEVNDGSVSAAISTLQTTLTTPIVANANSIDTLSSTINDPNTGLSATASATESLQTYVGIDAAGASSGTGLSAYLEGSDGEIGTAGSQLLNDIEVGAAVVESKFAYNSNLNINGNYYNSGFGLNSSLIDPGSGIPAGESEFWINADKFRFTNTGQTGTATPFTIDANGAVPNVTFNGLVTFGNSQTGTIDEAIASSIDSIQVGDKNINITDNLIPTTSLISDINNAGYQFIGDPVKSSVAGIDTFAEPQVVLDSNDEVYSPYVDEMFPPYYYRFGIKGITNLNSVFKVTTVNASNVVTYGDVTYSMNAGETLVSTEWYIVEGLVNPFGGDNTGLNGSIRTSDGSKIGTITNFALPSDADKLVLGWVGPCTISRMKLAKITADTFTGSVASIDYVDSAATSVIDTVNNAGYLLPEGVQDAIENNVTTIDGSKITTGSLSALSADLGIVTAGKMQSTDGKFVIDLDNKFIRIEV